MVSNTIKFEEIWKNIRKIRLEHERTLEALDVHLKDSIMQKSAEIGVSEGSMSCEEIQPEYLNPFAETGRI